jgi:hypothetical protein
MGSRTWRTAAAPLAALVAAGLGLAGCGGGGEAKETASPSPTTRAAPVTDEELGEALSALVGHGQSPSSDEGACFAEAVKNSGVSEAGQALIVEIGGDDLAAVAKGLRAKKLGDDAEALLSKDMRASFDACVDDQSPDAEEEAPDYAAPETPKPAKQGKPDLQPKYEVDEQVDIRSSTELVDGVVSMFSSFALDDEQRTMYSESGECMANAVFTSGLSQESLHFIAGGAPIGTGSIAEHLANDEDEEIWRSDAFRSALVDCSEDDDEAEPSSAPGGAGSGQRSSSTGEPGSGS